MNNHLPLLQVELYFQNYKPALLCFFTAFVVTLVIIPPIIYFVKRYKLYDMPGERKLHTSPIPTMGGIAILSGMMISLFFWFPFAKDMIQLNFFLAITVLSALGIMDDLKDLKAGYKFVIQAGLATLIALAGVRIHSFEGLFGINEIPVSAQYTITLLAIVGITNAFNLIDGIDGLAGGLGFMSLITLGILLTLNGDTSNALIAFGLAGGILAFLFFNFNPARIFMGDTGSLVLGFVIAVLCIRLLQANAAAAKPVLQHAPVYVLGIVMIPVFDMLRVITIRIWNGLSPFEADKRHIHHLMDRAGFSHSFAAKFLCIIHGLILAGIFWLRDLSQEFALALLVLIMSGLLLFLKNPGSPFKKRGMPSFPVENS